MGITSTNKFTKTALLGAAAALALGMTACKGGETKAASGASSKEVAKLTSGKSPIDASYKLKGGKELDFEALMISLSPTGDMDGFTFTESKFDSKIGATVVTGLTREEDGDMFSIGRLELYGVQPDQIEAVKTGVADGKMGEIFNRIRAFDVKLEMANPDLERAMRQAESKVDAAPVDKAAFGAGPSLAFEAIELNSLKIKPVNDEYMNGLEESAQFANALKSFDFGGMNIKGMKANFPEFNEDTPVLAATVADMRIGRMANGSLGPIAMKDFDYTIEQSEQVRRDLAAVSPQFAALINGPLGNFIMPLNARAVGKSVTWNGGSIAGMLPYLESGETPPASAKDLIAIGRFEANDFQSYIDGNLAAETKLSVLEPIEFSWMVPTKIRSYTKDQTLYLGAYIGSEDEAMMKVLEDADVKVIKGDSELEWQYDAKKGNANFEYVSALDGFVNLDMNFAASGAPLKPIIEASEAKKKAFEAFYAEPADGEAEKVFPTDLETGMENAAFKSFSFTVKDEKMLDLIFGIVGAQMGQEGAQMRAAAPGLIMMGGAQFNEMSPRVPGYMTALSSFITEGGELKIEMAPKEAVKLEAFEAAAADPAASIEMLDLKITHKK